MVPQLQDQLTPRRFKAELGPTESDYHCSSYGVGLDRDLNAPINPVGWVPLAVAASAVDTGTASGG